MREVIVIEGGGWERVLRVVDDAQIEHWQMLTLNLGAISKQDSIQPCSGCHSFWAISETILAEFKLHCRVLLIWQGPGPKFIPLKFWEFPQIPAGISGGQ